MFDDRPYFLRRFIEEREAANAAACPEARSAHLRLAQEFERKLHPRDDLTPLLTQ